MHRRFLFRVWTRTDRFGLKNKADQKVFRGKCLVKNLNPAIGLSLVLQRAWLLVPSEC